MEQGAYLIDDQPVQATLFGEGRWLTSYITPDEPTVQMLYDQLTGNLQNEQDKIIACWDWVANQVRYKGFIQAKLQIEGQVSRQPDYWQTPGMCAQTRVGNCANKAFLLTSLLRNFLPPDRVYCTLGNLYNGKAEGHAWVEVVDLGTDYIVESTRGDVPMIAAEVGDRYEPVHYFNDTVVYAMPGRTLMIPFSACYSQWLKDYLNQSYISYMGGH